MLQTIELSSWQDFEKTIINEGQDFLNGPNIYRGHPNATWSLETTLERSIGSDISVSAYYYDIKNLQSQIETFTDHYWDLPSYVDYNRIVRDGKRVIQEPVTSYMQYLRHFGYPSPLLDWTYSPFIAAYFAFRELTNKSDSVAIYQLSAGAQVWANSWDPSRITPEKPIICPIATASRKNKRHYLQQSVYTICLQKLDGDISFASHQNPKIIALDNNNTTGATIKKYIIPTKERMIVLQGLEAHNINAYSLMGTEESLLESLFLQTYTKRQFRKGIFDDSLGFGKY
jgi:hypothetical protein